MADLIHQHPTHVRTESKRLSVASAAPKANRIAVSVRVDASARRDRGAAKGDLGYLPHAGAAGGVHAGSAPRFARVSIVFKSRMFVVCSFRRLSSAASIA